MVGYAQWYFQGVGGMGGWLFFLACVGISSLYISVDSHWRKIPGSLPWLLATASMGLGILPGLLYSLTKTTSSTPPALFLLGLAVFGTLAGLAALGIAAVYALLSWAEPDTPPSIRRTLMMPTRFSAATPTRPISAQLNLGLINEATRQYYPLYQGQNSIGRRSTSEVYLRDKTVSRQHALIRTEPGRLVILDVGSKSGTYLNQQRIQSARIMQPGDLIGLGRVQLRLVYAAENGQVAR